MHASSSVNKNQDKRGKRKRNRKPKNKSKSTTIVVAPAKPPRQRRGNAAAPSRAIGNSSLYGRYAKQMENPRNISAPSVLPDLGANSVCARKYQRTVSYTQATYNKLRIAMFPNLFLPGFVVGGSAQTIPVAAAGPLIMQGTIESSSDAKTSTKGVLRMKDTVSVSAAGALAPIVDAAAEARKGFTCAVASGTLIKAVFKNLNHTGLLSTTPSPYVNLAFAAAAGNWVLALATGVLPEGKEASFECTVPAGGPFTKMSIWLAGTQNQKVNVEMSLSFSAAQFVTTASSSFAPAFSQQIIDQNITMGRVTHMSCFVQNTTSELSSTGTIVAARVPVGFDLAAEDGNWIQSASTLPDNRHYIGPMKNGAYVWWMPEQQDEFQIDNIAQKQQQYQDANYLLVEIPDWVAGATVEVTYTWIVEFYTSSQNFEKIVPPVKTELFDVMWHVLSRMPAASCNPDHEDYTKDMLAKVKHVVLTAQGFYDRHKDLIHGIGRAVATGLELM